MGINTDDIEKDYGVLLTKDNLNYYLLKTSNEISATSIDDN